MTTPSRQVRRARGRQRGKQQQRRAPLVPIALAVMVALAVVAVAWPDGDNGAAPATAPVQVEGEPLPELVAGSQEPAVGQPAPRLIGSALDGSPLTIAPDDGPMAVVFLAHWCPHCQREVTRLVPWLRSGGPPDGVELRAVSTLVDPARGNYPPAAWLQQADWPVATLADDDDSTAAEAYGLSGTPYWVFIDADGRVAARVSGELPLPQLERHLDQLAE